MNNNTSEVLIAALVVLLIVLCSGDPDIIDGWAKSANNARCERSQSQ